MYIGSRGFLEAGSVPRKWFKRLIIKHFGHTFDREKPRKLKTFFSRRNHRSKFFESENFRNFFDLIYADVHYLHMFFTYLKKQNYIVLFLFSR